MAMKATAEIMSPIAASFLVYIPQLVPLLLVNYLRFSSFFLRFLLWTLHAHLFSSQFFYHQNVALLLAVATNKQTHSFSLHVTLPIRISGFFFFCILACRQHKPRRSRSRSRSRSCSRSLFSRSQQLTAPIQSERTPNSE